ncbi:hypothetical protein EDB81DRAFT_772542 [Dactylonectria macrodidyma]|uniref:Uncharacterized protein n=1 Tax=Dactylonectria macrodidyma TaxID=307937 RepID=A0A9P9FTJ2_9HYPO|nr:hypothetical protein EDB81DRAFT_772542 [Dactylonectria macrodidyma]
MAPIIREDDARDGLDRLWSSPEELLSKLNLSIDDVRACLDEVRRAIEKLEESYAVLRDSNEDVGQEEIVPGLTLDQVQAHTGRLSARLHNSGLRDPSERICRVHAFDDNGNLELPNAHYYPRTAREFFSLRTSTSIRHQDMLEYLVAFYRIPIPILARSPPIYTGVLTAEGRDHAVDRLSVTLCLLEAGFILYDQMNDEQRAALVASAPGLISRRPARIAE